jgi:predicted  nucleic acid-binding Zn-ribbon protein
MDKQLEKLISLHDLDVMIADLSRKEIREKEADMGLHAEGAQEELVELREAFSKSINRKWLGLYNQLTKHYGNAVVPALMGRCSGCLTRLPTAVCSDPERNTKIHTCPTCGRITYWAD